MNSFLDKLFRWLRARKVIKHIPKDSLVCDIGCGRDFYFLKSISNFIDQGVGFNKEIEEHSLRNLRFKKVNILKNIPAEDEIFDVVSMMAVLEHLDYPKDVLKESFRILKGGGKLLITSPTPLARPVLETLAKLNLINKKDIKDHKHYFRSKDIKEMLFSAGFKEENIRKYFFEFFLNNLIIAQK